MIEGHELGSAGVDPQWLMFGVELAERTWPDEWGHGWRYLVAGSSDLSRAELVNELVLDRSRLPGSGYRRDTTVHRTQLTADLRSYILAFGATYAEAIARLFAAWSTAGPASGEQMAQARAALERDLR